MEEELMNDNDFVIVDPSTLQLASRSRSRKPKYTHKHWEKDDARSQHIYYSALQRSYRRRHKETETPYDHMVDEKKTYVEWWSSNTIHLVNIEQIRLENEQRVSTNIDGMCVCRYCGEQYDGNEAVYSWICLDCMDKEIDWYEGRNK